MKRRMLPMFFLLAFVAAFTGCTTVPESGRSQILLITPAEEAQSGAAAFLQIKGKEKVAAEPSVNARINRIGRRIAAVVGRDLPNANWEFVVFDSPQLNAFALPGGKVGFYTGLINLAGSDDEIAAVMGHEIAHVTSRHGAERQSQAMLVGLGGVLLNAGTFEFDFVCSAGSKVLLNAMYLYCLAVALATLYYVIKLKDMTQYMHDSSFLFFPVINIVISAGLMFVINIYVESSDW